MAQRGDVIVVGAGPGGLAAAMLLSHEGFRVKVLEKEDTVGGRSAGLPTIYQSALISADLIGKDRDVRVQQQRGSQKGAAISS